MRGPTFIDPAEADDIVAAAKNAHARVFVLSTGGAIGRDAFFSTVRAVLPLDPPIESSYSWEALSDSLWEGIRMLDEDAVVIVWPDAYAYKEHSRQDYDQALSTFDDLFGSIGDPVVTGGRPKKVGVYVGDG